MQNVDDSQYTNDSAHVHEVGFIGTVVDKCLSTKVFYSRVLLNSSFYFLQKIIFMLFRPKLNLLNTQSIRVYSFQLLDICVDAKTTAQNR